MNEACTLYTYTLNHIYSNPHLVYHKASFTHASPSLILWQKLKRSLNYGNAKAKIEFQSIETSTPQKMKFFIKDFYSKNFLTENFQTFCSERRAWYKMD